MNAAVNYDWSSFTAPLVELQKINQRAYEDLTRECMAWCNDNAGFALKTTQSIPSSTTNPDNFFKAQVDMIEKNSARFLECTQNVFDIWQDTLRQQLDWCQDAMTNYARTAGKVSKKSTETQS